MQLAERGMRITPLIPLSKRPLLANWQNDNNTCDLALIERWATQYRGCNWAVVCGPISHLWVADFDSKNNQPGLVQYQRWLEEFGPEFSFTLKVRTANNGLQLYFLWLEGIGVRKDNRGRLAQGVDVQGWGSYVVIPPSRIKTDWGIGYYHFEDSSPETNILATPEWLAEKLRSTLVKLFEHCGVVLPDDNETPIPAGHRWAVLTSYLGRLRYAGASVEELEHAALRIGRRFVPPYDERTLIKHARGFAHYKPAPLLILRRR